MRSRTRLTTPPGQQPEAADRPREQDAPAERYIPAFALPEEPRPPRRHRRAIVVVATLLVLVAVAWGILQVVTSGSDFDPAVGDVPTQQDGQLPDGGEGG